MTTDADTLSPEAQLYADYTAGMGDRWALREALRVICGGRPSPLDKQALTELFGPTLVDAGLAIVLGWTDVYAPTAKGREALAEMRELHGTTIGTLTHVEVPERAAPIGGDKAGVCAACSTNVSAAYWPCAPAILYWPDMPLDCCAPLTPHYIAALMLSPDDGGLYDRLVAELGPERAAEMNNAACNIYDHQGQVEAWRERLGVLVEDAMLTLGRANATMNDLTGAGDVEFEGRAGSDVQALLARAQVDLNAARALIAEATR
jgi:hypothetical protein